MFRIEYLKVAEHPQLGNLELFFQEDNEFENSIQFYSTVIIGPNGTGKSYILRTLIDLFRELYELKFQGKRRKYVTGRYNFKYRINGHQYGYSNVPDPKYGIKFQALPGGSSWRERGMTFYLEKDGRLVNADQIELPDSILANSIMLTDKYVFLSYPEEFNIYKYLGIRTSRSTSGTRSYIKNTIGYLANSSEKSILIEALPEILHFLELDNYLSLRYSVKRRDIFFTGNLNRETIISFIQNYEGELEERRKKESRNITPWFAYSHYKALLKDESLLNSLIEFCNQKVTKLKRNSSSGNYFEYNLLENLYSLENEITFINILEKLNLIGYPELCFRKMGTDSYSFEGASSGEAHYISSMIGMLSTIKNNSLILIDEPEISLHPNWQMKYMHFLHKILGKYKNCHFIIATHSHFIISDLKGESSRIIGLKRIDGKIETVDLPMNIDTYGWSAEEVLYSVFNVRSVRNYFLENDLTKLLALIGQGSKDTIEIQRLINKMESLSLSDDDPLKEIVIEANNYLSEND